MKRQNYFSAGMPPYFKGRPMVQFSPETGEGGVTFDETQQAEVDRLVNEAVEKAKPTLQNATSFIKNAGGIVYLSENERKEKTLAELNNILSEKIENPNEFQKGLINFKGSLIGQALTPFDKTIKELTGVEKDEGELTRDYAKRALGSFKKDGKVDEGEFNAIKGKLTTANSTIEQLQNQLKTVNNSILETERDGLIQKGIPSNLDYTPEELSFMLPGLNAQIHEAFDFQKDDRGFFAVNKQTGNPELNDDGTRKPVDVVVNEFASKVKGLKFKAVDTPGGALLPGQGGTSLNAEQAQAAQKKWEEYLQQEGLMGHEKDAHVKRKELGLPVSERAKTTWPELKDK